MEIVKERYEDCDSLGDYDIIFCVNVFEHLESWKNFLEWSFKRLNAGGKLIILCPNYSFPLESHFGIPIFFNKKITEKIFWKKIQKFEKKHDVQGLWSSLNFVKKYEVKRYLKKSDLLKNFNLQDSPEVMDQFVDRLLFDEQFKIRHPIFSQLVPLIKIFNPTIFFRLAPNYTPYMKIQMIKL